MRRLLALLGTAGMVTTGLLAAAPTAQAAASTPPKLTESAARGITYKGLRATDGKGHCTHGYQLSGSGRCTHGPDAAPPNVDVRYRRGTPVTTADTSTGSPSTRCRPGPPHRRRSTHRC